MALQCRTHRLEHSFVIGRRKVLSAIIFVGHTSLIIPRGKIVVIVDTVIFLRQVTGRSKLQIWCGEEVVSCYERGGKEFISDGRRRRSMISV